MLVDVKVVIVQGDNNVCFEETYSVFQFRFRTAVIKSLKYGKDKSKGTVHPRTDHEDPVRKQRYSSTVS
jgi:hypothetical protein